MGKITSFLADIISDTLKGVITQALLGSTFLLLLFLGFKSFLLKSVPVKLVILIPVTILAFGFLFLLYAKYFYRRKYLIPVERTHHEGIEINEYSRRTKWNYKSNNKYYFIPLISHSQHSANFVRFAGPFCAECDHVLRVLQYKFLAPRFFCVNCVKKHKVPTELIGDYHDKLMAYFSEEYRQRRLREAPGR